jgi:hypothetical protein
MERGDLSMTEERRVLSDYEKDDRESELQSAALKRVFKRQMGEAVREINNTVT